MVWEHEYEPWIDIEFTKADRGIWTQKNGEEINIKDMTDSHIQNTINMLKRRDCDNVDEYWIMTFEAEQQARKENKAKVMTNKEVINNMSTEELAKYLFSRGNYQEYCYGICAFQDDCDYYQEDDFCITQISKWLESENDEELR